MAYMYENSSTMSPTFYMFNMCTQIQDSEEWGAAFCAFVLLPLLCTHAPHPHTHPPMMEASPALCAQDGDAVARGNAQMEAMRCLAEGGVRQSLMDENR